MNYEKKDKFALNYSFEKYFWIFLIVSVIGFIYESILCIFQQGSLKSVQGMLFGPFTPVYGIGAVIFMYFFKNIKDLKIVFILGIVIGGVYEFLYSFLQEKIFGTISWDYSSYFLNFQGRTSIAHAIFWGMTSVIFVKWVYPFLSKNIEKVPIRFGNIITEIVVLLMLINLSFTVFASLRQNMRNKNILPITFVGYFFDEHYPDYVLDKVYSNHKRVN